MIVDSVRMDAYIRAMRQTIKPKSVVADLGSGPGLFALVACQLGARRVYAIEPNDIIQIGRDAAREHGLSDRIEFIQELSTNVTLPEQADVIVADLRGILPWYGQHLPSIVDARSRFLKPQGVLIPARDRMWAALVEVPEKYDELIKPWTGNNTGFSLNSGRHLAVNTWSKVHVEPDSLLSASVCWHEIEYGNVSEINFRENISLTATRGGVVHGLAVWFDSELFDGIGFTNAPGAEEMIYGQGFFPFEEAVQIAAADRVDVVLEARLIGDHYVWRWDTTVSLQSGTNHSFRQSTLLGEPFSTSELRKRAKAP